MKSVLDVCTPRDDLLKGTFNPEIFTASLDAVLKFYRGETAGIHSVYRDAREFFQEATFPSQGLRSVVGEVFTRLSGDNSVPAIHRLETGFGGGKTHTLIACAHLGYKGSEIADVVSDIIDPTLMPAPGSIHVVGIAGDKLPVHKPMGTQLLPYTLWGEIAYQIGGEALYRQVEQDAQSYAAPGENYFQTVFNGRKVLLMIDELAQYAARFSAARPEARQMLEAFLLPLHGYARENSGLAIVETLASAKDAFANQTVLLMKLLSEVTGKEIDQDSALGIGQQAIDGIASVVARDATAVVPVQPSEISRVLAKRLFTRIDSAAAIQTAADYAEMYAKNPSLMPDEALRVDFKDRLAATYPFHPTLINFLNHKLAVYENFQSTRGVLRVLSLAVRAIWEKRRPIPMIQTCHLDLRDARTVNELIGRTGSGDLLAVLNADVGGADTDALTGGKSNAQLADQRNPHPEGHTMYEYTWKTVFLHSLVGRDQGLVSNIFGLTEQEAIFETAFPGLTPPQVAEALAEISRSAFYLRLNHGRYYASLDPSVNIALAQIRRSLSEAEVKELLDAFARKVVGADTKAFKVVHDVAYPEHIPDKIGRPVLALVGLNAGEVDIEALLTTAGPNRARVDQNQVLVLVPESVQIHSKRPAQQDMFTVTASNAQAVQETLYDLARTVLAMRKLDKNPQAHGIQAQKLQKEGFKQRFSEREKALETTVTESYRQLWYPSAGGQFVFREIRTAGGESGAAVLEQIRKTLIEDGELITLDRVTSETLTSLKKLFFGSGQTIKIGALQDNFARLRNWPMIESSQVLHKIIRDGVSRGVWCLFHMGSQEASIPEEFYSRDTGEVPLHVELTADYGIVTPEGAIQRGWTGGKAPDPVQVESWVQNVAHELHTSTVEQIKNAVSDRFGAVEDNVFNHAIVKLVQKSRILAHKGALDQDPSPQLIGGDEAVFFQPDPTDVIVTPATAAENGWIKPKNNQITLSGKQGAQCIVPLLRRIGSLYQKGAKTPIDLLDISDLQLPAGGRLRISLEDATPESLKEMGELFEVVDALAGLGDSTEAFVEIKTPVEDCPFVRELLNEKKDH
jgi:hypothetical protein